MRLPSSFALLLTLSLSLSAAGCAADPSMDDLDGTDGKGDSFNGCIAGDYEAWLRQTYFPKLVELKPLGDDDVAQLREVASKNPCATGGDDAFRFWFAAW